MIKQLTYPESRSVKWLAAVLLALSCFAFSVSPVSSTARMPQTAQIEQVLSSDANTPGPGIVLYHPDFAKAHSFSALKKSEHELNSLLVQNTLIHVAFNSLSTKLNNSPPTGYYRHMPARPLYSDKDLPSEIQE